MFNEEVHEGVAGRESGFGKLHLCLCECDVWYSPHSKKLRQAKALYPLAPYLQNIGQARLQS